MVYITLIREKDKLRRYNPFMSTTNDLTIMSKLHAFNQALNSLDGEVASFITSLIDQNAELANKLEHIDSLAELAEKTVIEAGKEAERIKADDEQLLASSKLTAESPARVSEELCTRLNSDARSKAASMEEENESSEPPEPEAAVCVQLDVFTEKPVEEPAYRKKERDDNKSLASYDNFVDLVIQPPISWDQMLRVYKHLNRNPGVKVLDLKGSLSRGLWLRFIVLAHTPLLTVFEALSEVGKVSYEVIEVGKISLAYPRKIPPNTAQHADGRKAARPKARQ